MRSVMPFAFAVALLAAPALAGPYPGHPKTTPDINAADLSARDKAVADDAFQGRGPGTKVGEMAAQWIADEMKRIGLKPGNNGSYFQQVPAVTITLDPTKSSLSFDTAKGALTPKFADEVVFWSPQFAKPEVKVEKSPLVFVGYGVVAPEYNWNDYAGIDVKGKDRRHPDQRSRQRSGPARRQILQGQGDDVLWPLDLQIRGSRAPGRSRRHHRARNRFPPPMAGRWCAIPTPAPKSWLDETDQNTSMVPIQGWIASRHSEGFVRARGPRL